MRRCEVASCYGRSLKRFSVKRFPRKLLATSNFLFTVVVMASNNLLAMASTEHSVLVTRRAKISEMFSQLRLGSSFKNPNGEVDLGGMQRPNYFFVYAWADAGDTTLFFTSSLTPCWWQHLGPPSNFEEPMVFISYELAAKSQYLAPLWLTQNKQRFNLGIHPPIRKYNKKGTSGKKSFSIVFLSFGRWLLFWRIWSVWGVPPYFRSASCHAYTYVVAWGS